MLRSMTGFARCERRSAFGELAWEVRSVNHRYLDLQFRLPDALRGCEAGFRRTVSERLGRGKVDLSLTLRRDTGDGAGISIDEALIARIADAVERVRARIGDSAPADPLEVLRWPGVIEDQPVALDELTSEAAGLLEETLGVLDDTRAREGDRIAGLLTTRAAEIGRLVGTVRARRPEVLAAVEQKLRERIARLAVDAEPGRVETELAIIAQKLDVDEELDRIDGHLTEIARVLERDEPVGRRLDFLMQELNREANTLGSKSGDAETTGVSVELKVLIEQMREQIQNIE